MEKYGLSTFEQAAMSAFENSDKLTGKRLSQLRSGSSEAADYLEGPGGEELELKVKATLSKSGISFDYTGTSAEVDYPLNAVLGVTISGAHFVLRCLLGDDIPANFGAFARVKVSVPPGTLLNPTSPHPVGGGNVETSQRNADVLLRALAALAPGRIPAASGGSMNNVMVGGTFEGSPWAFYETVGVGLGGSRTADGIDGIQANMTNTLNTPIESIERTFPFRIVRYEFRPDSAGAGRSRGGSGLIRSYQSLSGATTFTVLADRERHRPWGLDGGRSGAGTSVVLIRGGRPMRIPSKSTLGLAAGDVVEVMTAGGGGYGDPSQRRKESIRSDVEDGLLRAEKAGADYHSGREPKARRPHRGNATRSRRSDLP